MSLRPVTFTQPASFQAYLAGVIVGDGWLTSLTLGLRVKDEDFAQAFAFAVERAFAHVRSAKPDERGYWLYRTSNKTGRFDSLRGFRPEGPGEMAAWVRGLFDSEGNASLRHNGVSENSYGRRVAFYSTNHITLAWAEVYLRHLGIGTRRSQVKPSAGHLGRKPVYELAVSGSHQNYALFATLISSSIARKRSVLEAIPESYCADVAARCRAAQAKGASIRRARRDRGGVY